MPPMLSKKEIIRRTERIIDHANEQLDAARKEVTGMLQVIACLVDRLGGSVTIPEKELADRGGAFGMSFDKEKSEWTIELLVEKTPEEQETALAAKLEEIKQESVVSLPSLAEDTTPQADGA